MNTKHTDKNKREIRVGDTIVYGYGFYSAPVAGVVIKILKNGVKFIYRSRIRYENKYRILDTIAKKTNCVIVVSNLSDNKNFIDLFDLQEVFDDPNCPELNRDLIAPTVKSKTDSFDDLEDI